MIVKSILFLASALAIACVSVATFLWVTEPALLVGTPVADDVLLEGLEFTEGYHPVRLLRPIKPITKFPVMAVKDVKGKIDPAELVIAVTVGDEARAYPVNMLTGPSREILNDTLGGTAIAATW